MNEAAMIGEGEALRRFLTMSPKQRSSIEADFEIRFLRALGCPPGNGSGLSVSFANHKVKKSDVAMFARSVRRLAFCEQNGGAIVDVDKAGRVVGWTVSPAYAEIDRIARLVYTGFEWRWLQTLTDEQLDRALNLWELHRQNGMDGETAIEQVMTEVK